MLHYQIWNGTDEIYTPSGAHFTAEEWRARYPWINIPGAKMIITNGIINGGAAMEYTSTIEMYKRLGAVITDDMSDEQVLSAIQDYENNPPGSNEPTTEERTAAALEYIAMSSLPDAEEV